MKRFFLFLCAATLTTLQLLAVPAMPGKHTFINPDGTTVEYELRGDEFYHFMADAENNVLEKNASGFLVAKEQISNETVAARRAASPVAEAYKARQAGTVNLAPRGLFILVNFQGKSFQSGNTLSAMQQMISSTGHTYTYNGATGSMLDYFIDQSGDQYHPQFDVFGPVTVSQSSSYYAGSDGTELAYKMVIEACQGLDNQVNFANYDNDGDGYVDFIYVIYAGKGQADGGGSTTIWPHQYNVSYKQSVTLDGVKLGSYACGGELNGSSGARNGIGTMCHEFSHVLGLPDYYDTNYGTNYNNSATPGKWHLMDQGSYNNNQNTPAGYAPHDKYFMGWYTPTILNDPENVTLPADGETYRMINSQKQQLGAKSTQTIYYLENRQKTGWNAYVPGHGLLVWKVTYNASKWNSNTPNNTAGTLNYALVSASGNTNNIGNARDAFPGSGNVTTYTPISGNGLTDIEESNSEIHFKFDGGITRPYTVTFVAGDHATCATTTLTQASMGASIRLPNVTNISANYKFLGWSATEGAVTAECGTANASYVPKRDITLYAVVVQDGYLVTFDTETYGTTLGHGSCPVSELREAGSGAGIVLPEFTADPGYVFQGWVYISNDRLYLAGETGDRVFPAQDMTLYSYVFPSDSVFCEYTIMSGVEKTSGPDQGWFRAADGYTATFVAADQFYPLTAANTTVRVKVDGDLVANCYSFANNTLTISLTANQIVGDVEVNIWATSDYTPCANYSYTYAQGAVGVGTKTLGAYSWSITGTVSQGTFAGQWNSNANRLQGGTNRKCTQATYTTNSANDCLIDKITVTAWCTRANGTIQAYINNEALGDAQTLTASQAEYTFSNSSRLQGQVKFVINNATSGQSYYIYVKAINVTMVQDIAITPPGEPIHIQGINYIQALYRNYYYGYDQYEPWYLWYPVGIGSDASDYPWINFIMEAPIKTALTGTHNTLGITGYVTSASDTTEAWNESYKIKFTYLRDTTYLYTSTQGSFNVTSYIYHVESRWIDDITGQEYYIDDDAYADIYDYDAYQDGNYDDMEITPTGDTNPRYGKIRHYLQHIDDDGYDLDEEVVMTAPAGTTLEAERNSYNGFLYPAAQNITITNANTSQANAAVVDYYYDRRTYQVNFIVDGTTTQSETLRYGATPTYKQAAPTRQATAQYSYTFAGWSPTIRIVRQSDTYTALFDATEHIVVSFNNNGRGIVPDNQTLEAGQTVTRPADPTAEGYTFGGWYTEAGCVNAWNFSTPVNASMTLYAKWTANTHTLTWNANGGQLSGTYTSGSVAYGDAITAPTATRQGYTFAGWGANVPATMPDNDLSFTAQWQARTDIAYTVKHYKEALDGSWTLAETENFNNGTTGASITLGRKTYEGFDQPAAQTVTIDGSGTQTFTYQYPRKEYTLTWDGNGGTVNGNATISSSVKFEAAISAPNNVVRTGYDFTVWSPTPAATMPAANTTYTAQWQIKTYSGITFTSEDINKGTVSVTGQKEVYNYGDEVTITATPKAGYSFSKWSDNNTTASRTLRIGIDISASLVASFSANTNTPYLVHFFKQNLEDDNYTEQLPAEQCQGTTGTLTNAAEVLKSYPGFTRLDYNEEIIAGDGSTEINVYYDRQTFVIRFLVDGVVKQNQTLRFGATPVYAGAEPTRAATAEFTYTFKNWSPAIATVSQAQDYEAVFNEIRNNYTVTFNANGHATAPAPQNIAYGSKVTEPEALSETGYTFGGWFKEAGCANAWNFSTDVVTGTLELFAKWTINTHRVSWDGNGGTLSGDYTSGNAIEFGTAIVAPTAERAGYHFDGWIPSVPATMPDNDLDFVAQWSANNNTAYTVRHMQENVENSNFTLAEEQTLYGTTDGPTNATAKTYTGFTAQAFSQSTIAGNGSTVIEIQYKRNLYTLSWDENGGDALTGNYTQGQVKFGATITAPNEPTRTGWEFKGWNPAVPATMPADNVTYTATWAKAGDTPYKVEHYKQQLDGTYSATPDEVDNEKGETDSEITPATRNYTGFTAPATQTTTIDAGGNTVVVYQYARNKHSLTWDANGGNLSGSYTEGDNIFFDAAITAPTPSRTGYDFAGWGAEVPAKMPDEDLAFVAHWTAKTNIAYRIEHYQQNIDNDNYTLFEFEDKTGTADATITPAVKNYTGFTAPTALPVTINPDGSLVVVYEYTRNSYSLVWNADGGQIVDNGYTHGSVKYDAPIIAPADPTKTGHTFHAWDKAIPSNMPADNLTIKALWTINTFSGITFTSNDEVAGTVSVDNEKSTYEYGDQVNITATENEGYHFEGWSDGNDQANRTITIDENSESLVANFAPNTNTPYVVKHFKQNLENDEYTEVVADRQELEGTTGEKIQINPKNYDGFITPSSQADQIAIAGNGSSVIEYRYERRSFSIEWDANGGELSGEYSQGSLKFEAPITEPGIHRDGHIFKGWNENVPTTMPARALSFIANWEAEKYDNISFESANEEMGTVSVDPEKDEYSYGESVTITATANDGYTFTGWVDENGDPVSSDPTTTIVIDATTGTVTATFSANTDTKFFIRRFLQNIEDDNFTFLDEEEAQGTTGAKVSPEPAAIEGFETPETQEITITGDGKAAVIYNYIRKKFNLVWNANGGQLISGQAESQVKFQAPIVAAEAEWSGHIFLGWLPADIPATMPANDLTFVAQWEAETVEGITFASSDETAGSITVDPEKDVYEVGDVVTVTAEANDGYSFSGWSDGNTDGAEREITIDKNTPDSIVAIFTPNEGYYEIRIFLQNIEDDEFTFVDSIKAPGRTGELADLPEITGFTAPEEAPVVTIILNANNVVELRYTRNSYNLVWNADGGIIPEGEFTQGLVKFEAPIVAPADPVREGFNFLGWGNVPATMPAEDLTLTAQWEEAQGIEIVIEGRTIFSDEEIRIYDFNGRDVTGLNGHLGNGMYIVVGGGSAVKIAIQ